jgi:hypothetical protein
MELVGCIGRAVPHLTADISPSFARGSSVTGFCNESNGERKHAKRGMYIEAKMFDVLWRIGVLDRSFYG